MSAQPSIEAASELMADDVDAALAMLDLIIADPNAAVPVQADASYLSARCALQTGNPNDALGRIADARRLYYGIGDELSALRTDLGRINVLDDLGRHVEASMVGHHLIEALEAMDVDEIDEATQGMSAWLYAAALENQGACLGCLGQHDTAAAFLERAAEAYLDVGAPEDRARVQANLGVEKLELGDPDAALSLLTGARATLVKAGDEALARRCTVYSAQADALAGRYGSALDRLAQAADGAPAAIDDLDGIRLAMARAEVLATLNLWPEVIELAQQLGEATEAAGMRRDHARVLELSARALLQTDHREEATDVARRSIALLDELELPARAAQARLALAAALPPEDALTEVRRALDSYDEAGEKWGVAAAAVLGAEIASELDEPSAWSRTAVSTQAAEYPELHWRLETALGRSAMADGRVDAARRHHQESLDTLRSLRSGVHAGLDRVPFMSNRRSSLEAMVSLLLDEGDVAAARTLSSAERAWSMVTADEASEPIPGTVLYQMLDDQLSAFVTTEDGATTHLDLDVDRATLDYSRRRIQSQWRRIADRRMRVHLDQLRPAANAVFQELYLAIFEPIDRLFGEEFPITVVPVGSLSGIPFGLLHDGLSYMIERRAIHVTPHEGIPIRETGRRWLVVGVPDAVAPEIEREALQVAEVTGGELILGRDATRAAVCEAMPEFDVIHLAGHGRYRSDDAGLSGVALADGWLTAQEIQHVGLDGQLVVLAACSSGLQRSMGEDEALGLPRALLAAGAGSVVMNLWPADDLASVGLMTSFHSNLHAFAPHDALRRAQFSAMSNHPHPLLWGAPVLYGPQPALTTYEEFSHATAQTNR